MNPVRIALFCWLCICLTGVSIMAQDRGGGRRRSFDPASFLQRMDANGNGALESSEMSGRTQQFIEGLGFDTSQTIPLEKVIAKINGDRAESEQASQQPSGESSVRNGESARKVPSFRMERTTTTLPSFSGGGTTVSEKSLEGKYGAALMEQVNGAMQRYDKNADGVIDGPEIAEARWGQPDPKESDLNGDGRLSKAEMAERYYRRERARAAESDPNSNAAGSPSETGDGGERSSRRERDPGSRRSRDESSGDSGRSEASGSSGTSSPESSSRESRSSAFSSSSADKFRKYADGLIVEYDANKDGRLDKEEIGKMKQRPENADLDNDGFVSAGELTEALATGNMRSGGSSSAPAKSESARTVFRSRSEGATSGSEESSSSGRSSEESPSSGRSSSSPFSFNASDKNGDGQVQMHEFTNDWNEEKLRQFQEYDTNRDGVITNTEYRNKSKK